MVLSSLKELDLEFLLSKTITAPLLCLLIYKTIISPSKKSSTTIETTDDLSQKKETATVSPQYTAKYGALGVPIQPESPSFDWRLQQPYKYRPFKKGPYKMVMGIHNIPPSEWFLIEDTYKEYTDLKAAYAKDPKLPRHIFFLADDAIEATIEFYEMTVQFLLERYPMYFEIKGDKLYNSIRDEFIPLNPREVEDPNQLNVYLSTQIEEDFIILFQDPENYGTDEYIFKSGVFAFAGGFDPAKRAYKPLSAVHGPVPEYREKLRPQMNKFFEKFKPYSYVRRNNWSIQTHNKLCNITIVKGEEDEELKPIDLESLDYRREVYFRSERQILTRLPRTGAIVFSIRTYCTPMSDIRDEVSRGELIGGIEGMQDTIGQYKRKPEWGDAVIKFLMGETDGTDKPWIGGLE